MRAGDSPQDAMRPLDGTFSYPPSCPRYSLAQCVISPVKYHRKWSQAFTQTRAEIRQMSTMAKTTFKYICLLSLLWGMPLAMRSQN